MDDVYAGSGYTFEGFQDLTWATLVNPITDLSVEMEINHPDPYPNPLDNWVSTFGSKYTCHFRLGDKMEASEVVEARWLRYGAVGYIFRITRSISARAFLAGTLVTLVLSKDSFIKLLSETFMSGDRTMRPGILGAANSYNSNVYFPIDGFSIEAGIQGTWQAWGPVYGFQGIDQTIYSWIVEGGLDYLCGKQMSLMAGPTSFSGANSQVDKGAMFLSKGPSGEVLYGVEKTFNGVVPYSNTYILIPSLVNEVIGGGSLAVRTVGIHLRETASNKIERVSIGFRQDVSGLRLERWPSVTGPPSYITTLRPDVLALGSVVIIQVWRTINKLIWFVSVDNIHFHRVFEYNLTEYFNVAPDKIGVSLVCRSDINEGADFYTHVTVCHDDSESRQYGRRWFPTAPVTELNHLAVVPYVQRNLTVGVYFPAPGFETLTISGGVTPYDCILYSGAFPPGLGINPVTGAITGIPIAGGYYIAECRVLDSAAVPEERRAFVAFSVV